MDRIRPPAVAGSFYPAGSEELTRLLDECFVSSPLGPQGARSSSESLLGGMVPHAGYIYSGPCAAHLYAQLDSGIERVILLGVNHRGRGHKAALSPAAFWQTPLGRVELDREFNDSLAGRLGFLTADERAHRDEHSIEVQLPFLQKVVGEYTLAPISLSDLSLEECAELGRAIAENCSKPTGSRKKTVLLASSDLSHYLSPQETEELDALALEKVLALDPAALFNVVEQENISMCGVVPTVALLFAANALGATRAHLLKHCHSGDTTRMRQVVGYASVAIHV
jgi:MEMO1 family protein